MRRCEMEPVLVSRVRQESAPLLARAQPPLHEPDVAEVGHHPADIKAPMRIEVVHDPVAPLNLGEPARDVSQMRREVHAGSGRPQVADDLPRCHDEGSDQGARPVADVVVLAFLGLAGLGRLRGRGSPQRLHPRLLITADQQPTLLVHRGCLDIQLANRVGLGVEVGVMAVEPVDAPVWLEIGLVEGPPDRRAAHRPVMVGSIDQRGGQVVECPACGRLLMFRARTAGQGDHIKPLGGGKSSAADLTVEHPEAQPTPAADSGFARFRRCGDRSRTRRRCGGWWAGPRRRPSGSNGSERPEIDG